MQTQKRPVEDRLSLNTISTDYLNKLELDNRDKKIESFIYNSNEVVNITVDSAVKILPSLVDYIKLYSLKNEKFSVLLDGDMNLGKTILIRYLYNSLKEEKSKTTVIAVTGNNVLCYKIMKDGKKEIKDIVKMEYRKQFKGMDKDKVSYTDREEKDAIMTNINNLEKTLEALEADNEEYIVIFDECHVLFSEFFFRNKNKMMNRFADILKNCTDSNIKNNCKGVIFSTATADVFNCNKSIKFTRVYSMNLEEEYRLKIDLMESIKLKNNDYMSKLAYMADWYKENKSQESVLAVYLNNIEDSEKYAQDLKMYMKTFRKDVSNEDVDKLIAMVNAEHTEDNEALDSIMTNSTISKDIKIIFITSYVNAGIEIIINDRAVDMIIFADKSTFNLMSECQSTGRFRRGIRKLMLVTTTEAEQVKIKKYIDYVNERYDIMVEKAKNAIEWTNDTAKNENMSIEQALKTFTEGKERVHYYPFNHIYIKNNKCEVDEIAIYSSIYESYQKTYNLASIETLKEAIYNHKTINVNHLAKTKELNYSQTTHETLGISKSTPKKEKGVRAMSLIKEINSIKAKSDDKYIEKVLVSGEIEHIEYEKVVKEEDGSKSILIVKNQELKRLLQLLMQTDRYAKSSSMFTKDNKKNKKIIKELLNEKIPNKKIAEKATGFKATVVNNLIELSPISKQEEIEKKLKKNDRETALFIESKKAIDIVLGDGNLRNVYITNKMKSKIFEHLAYAEIAKMYEIDITWNQDGTPSKYSSKNKEHVDFIQEILLIHFNIDRCGKITSRKSY